jgi:hypothetical protein
MERVRGEVMTAFSQVFGYELQVNQGVLQI